MTIAVDVEIAKLRADLVDDDWVKEMNAKGLNGQQLLDCAKGLILKHTR